MLILAVPVDKGGSASANVSLHIPSASLLAARRLLLWEETDLQLAAIATQIQPVVSDVAEKSDPALRITIRNQ